MTPSHIPPAAIPEIAAANSNLSDDSVLLRREPAADLFGFLCVSIAGVVCALLIAAYLFFGFPP